MTRGEREAEAEAGAAPRAPQVCEPNCHVRELLVHKVVLNKSVFSNRYNFFLLARGLPENATADDLVVSDVNWTLEHSVM